MPCRIGQVLVRLKWLTDSVGHLLVRIVSSRFMIFSATLNTKWVETTFPFTYPSWELEIEYKGKWYEVLGCGIIRQDILNNGRLEWGVCDRKLNDQEIFENQLALETMWAGRLGLVWKDGQWFWMTYPIYVCFGAMTLGFCHNSSTKIRRYSQNTR